MYIIYTTEHIQDIKKKTKKFNKQFLRLKQKKIL